MASLRDIILMQFNYLPRAGSRDTFKYQFDDCMIYKITKQFYRPPQPNHQMALLINTTWRLMSDNG